MREKTTTHPPPLTPLVLLLHLLRLLVPFTPPSLLSTIQLLELVGVWLWLGVVSGVVDERPSPARTADFGQRAERGRAECQTFTTRAKRRPCSRTSGRVVVARRERAGRRAARLRRAAAVKLEQGVCEAGGRSPQIFG